MAEMWKPQPTEVYKSWVDAIISEASDELSTWESEFVNSIDGQLMHNERNLSEKQANILERIYAEKTK